MKRKRKTEEDQRHKLDHKKKKTNDQEPSTHVPKKKKKKRNKDKKFPDHGVQQPHLKPDAKELCSAESDTDRKKAELCKEAETKTLNHSSQKSSLQNSVHAPLSTDGGELIPKKRKTGTCMKHKKKEKIFKHGKRAKHKLKDKTAPKDGSENPVQTPADLKGQQQKAQEVVDLPTTSGEFSANWKELSKVLEKQKKKKQVKAKDDGRWKNRQKKWSKSTSPPEETSVADKATPEVWFDDVDDILIETKTSVTEVQDGDQGQRNSLVKPQSFEGLTKVLAIDCEMVGVGESGKDSILARVSLVNQYGQCVYDEYVKATEAVTDYRTAVSGIHKHDMAGGKDFSIVQKKVSDMLKGRVLVGHALHHDLQVLYLDHPRKQIRDTSRYKPFRSVFQGRTPSLKKLTQHFVKVAVQTGEHSSVQDAQAAMRLYTMYRHQWEKDIRDGKHKPKLVKERKEKKRNPSNLRRLKNKKGDKT